MLKDKINHFSSKGFLSMVTLTCVKLKLLAKVALWCRAYFNSSKPGLLIPHSFKFTIFRLLEKAFIVLIRVAIAFAPLSPIPVLHSNER